MQVSSGLWESSVSSVYFVTEISETERQVSAMSQLFSTRGPQGQLYLKETMYKLRITAIIRNINQSIFSIVVNEREESR